ncbi:hypothetical protein [Vibrio rumoiensis]|uniref:hypothetical protein n=1 Tax=Vibrio rumoiensis TaxID=76258 RepID=UPI000B5CE6F2|nr:hypothetical protein [Vibrio rumoiensis]
MDIMTISVILGAAFAFTFLLEGFIRAIRATFGHLIHLASKLLQLCWTMTKAVAFDFPFYFYGAFNLHSAANFRIKTM